MCTGNIWLETYQQSDDHACLQREVKYKFLNSGTNHFSKQMNKVITYALAMAGLLSACKTSAPKTRIDVSNEIITEEHSEIRLQTSYDGSKKNENSSTQVVIEVIKPTEETKPEATSKQTVSNLTENALNLAGTQTVVGSQPFTAETIRQEIEIIMDAQVNELKATLESAEIERIPDGIKISFDPSVYFGYNQKTLNYTAQQNIIRVVDVLNRYDHSLILVEGHTDAIGSEQQNQQVSEHRAKNISDYMIKKGISAERIAWIGLGEIAPVADNTTETGRRRNRRVHLIITMNENTYKAILEKKSKV